MDSHLLKAEKSRRWRPYIRGYLDPVIVSPRHASTTLLFVQYAFEFAWIISFFT